jgi:hypothetical protein
MESSTVIAFRALVMLACLIVVPLAAIFGSQFPDVVKSVLIDRFWPPAVKAGASDATLRAEAPPFAAAAAPGWRADAPPAATPNAAPGSAPPPLHAAPQFNSGVEPAAAWGSNDGHVRHAGGEYPASAAGGVQRADGTAPGYGAGSAAAVPGYAASGPPAGGSPAGTTQVLTQPDRFTWMERRLRDYGATYYLLETWVNEGERYRFICRMALANNPGHTRNFESTDTDPLRAMGRVVEQVEAWRAGRLP